MVRLDHLRPYGRSDRLKNFSGRTCRCADYFADIKEAARASMKESITERPPTSRKAVC